MKTETSGGDNPMNKRKTEHDNREESGLNGEHLIIQPEKPTPLAKHFHSNLYELNDHLTLNLLPFPMTNYVARLGSIDELLERDKQREKDGFPKKINVGKLVKPGKGGKDKIVLVPTTVEEKFIHDKKIYETGPGEGHDNTSGGSGEGEEGEIIGEEPVHATGRDQPDGAGQGEGGQHEIESNAYDLGRILTEKFELPNLQNKGKKRSLTRYTYDLTDRHKGTGQFLDKKATLRKIIETNMHLGNMSNIDDIDPSTFLVSPNDKIYRIMSKEKDYESQAVVFFLRDYSGSMSGDPTDLIVSQHVMIYSWLLFQYDRQIETRFILHDSTAKEVTDFYTYYNSSVAGGTKVQSAYKLVNDIVERESLAEDYNVYVFHGTDGDDWDKDGKTTIPELQQMLSYASRVGITVAEPANRPGTTILESFIRKSNMLEENRDKIRLDAVKDDAGEDRIIEGIKRLIS